MSHIVGYGTKADWHWDALAAVRVGRHAGTRSTTTPSAGLYDGGLGIARSTWAAFGGREFAPNAGLATREEQIIVGQRIYDHARLGPVGLRTQRPALATCERACDAAERVVSHCR